MTHPLTLALQWADRGFPAFPVAISWDQEKQGTNKRPLTIHGHVGATTDLEVLRDLMVNPPLSMHHDEVLAVGLLPGAAGYVVLDCDRHGTGDGPGKADSIGATYCWTVDTASGGEHRYFRKPRPKTRPKKDTDPAPVYGNTVPADWHGLIDVRADKGWVVAPGTVTPWGAWTERLPWTGAVADLPEAVAVLLRSSTGGGGSGASPWKRYVPATHEALLHPRTVETLMLLVEKHGVDPNLVTFHEEAGRDPWLQFTRPGKGGGTSAGLGKIGPGVLKMFSSGWLAFPAGVHDPLVMAHLETLQEPAKERPRHRVVRYSEVTEEKVTWIWKGWLPEGKVTLLNGDPGVGKSTLSLEIAAHVTTGNPWTDGTPCPLGNVLILSAEDGHADTIRPRLRVAGADLDRVMYFDGLDVGVEDGEPIIRDITLGDAAEIEAVVQEYGITLVIVDVLMAYLPTGVDSHKDQDVRQVLRRLAGLAERTGTCVLLLRHLNKGSGSALYRGAGSIGISGAARSDILVAKDPHDEGLVVMASTKVNVSATPDALSYRIPISEDVSKVEWVGPVAYSANDLVADQGNDEDRAERDALSRFLMDTLAKNGGTMSAKDATAAIREAFGPVAKATMSRVRHRAGVVTEKAGMSAGWVWRLDGAALAVAEGSTKVPKGPTPGSPEPSEPSGRKVEPSVEQPQFREPMQMVRFGRPWKDDGREFMSFDMATGMPHGSGRGIPGSRLKTSALCPICEERGTYSRADDRYHHDGCAKCWATLDALAQEMEHQLSLITPEEMQGYAEEAARDLGLLDG